MPSVNKLYSLTQDRVKFSRNVLISVILLYVFLIHKSFQQSYSVKKATDVGSRTAKELFLNHPIPEECKTEIITNGSFDEGTKGWKFIGPSTGMKLVPGTSGYALSTVTREEWFFGQAQNLNKDCFKSRQLYEVSADIKIVDYDGNPVSCDPFNKHFSTDSCPTLALKLIGKEVATRDIGKSVGPWKLNGWNKIYGIFEATDDLFMQDGLEVYITKLDAKKNAIIDNVSIKPFNGDKYGYGTCHELIANGDASTGDSRFWHIKGNGGTGTIDIVSPGASGENAFHHTGDRQDNFNGMWQELNQNCLPVGSTWKISFKMKLLDSSGVETSCDKTQIVGDASCPTIIVESHTVDKGIHATNLLNEAPGQWDINGWNEFLTTFTMTEQHAAKDETSIFINNIPSSYGYKIDEISMVRWMSS